FQAEDGIRDKLVTGVQTCALPIWRHLRPVVDAGHLFLAQPPLYKIEKGKGKARQTEYAFSDAERDAKVKAMGGTPEVARYKGLRSEERRVGKEWRARWWRRK